MLQNYPSVTGRIITFLSLAILLLLSFTVLTHSTVNPTTAPTVNSHIYRRLEILPTTTTTTAAAVTTTTSSAPSITTTTTEAKPTTTTTTTTTTTDATTSTASATTTTTTTTPSSSSVASSSTTTTTTSAPPKATATVIGSVAPTTYTPIVYGTSTQPEVEAIPTESGASNSGGLATSSGRTATYVVLSIVLVALAIFAIAMFLRRRSRRNSRLHEEASFYEEKAQPDFGATGMGGAELARGQSVRSQHSLFEPEMEEAMQPVDAAGAYPDRAVHYGGNDFTYPPAAPAASYNHQEQAYDHPYDQHSAPQHEQQYDQSYDAHAAYAAYDYQASASDHQHQQYDAGHGQYDHGLAPPSAFREQAGRGSGMDQSIDSFYGGVADPTLSQHIGTGY